jgi:hypothetical protein
MAKLNATRISHLCGCVSEAVSVLSHTVSSPRGPGECLDALWGLQDQLHRLVDALSDFPHEAGEFMEEHYSELLQRIRDVMNFVSKTEIYKNTVILRSCKSIDESLAEIARITELV